MAHLIKSYPTNLFINQLIENFELIYPPSETEVILCLENGYAMLKESHPESETLIKDKSLTLREVLTVDQRGNINTLSPIHSTYTLKFNRRNALVKFSFPLFTSDKIVIVSPWYQTFWGKTRIYTYYINATPFFPEMCHHVSVA